MDNRIGVRKRLTVNQLLGSTDEPNRKRSERIGQDVIGSSVGHDIYLGGPGDNSISSDGGEGKVLVGGTWADLIKGASGNDLLLDGASPWETNLSATELKSNLDGWCKRLTHWGI